MRRRENKTDYRKRLDYLKSGMPRAVVRKTNNQVIVQVITYSPEGDETVASAKSNELEDFGWKANTGNLPAAYLTGLLCGYKAKKEGINNVIPDLGLQNIQYGTRIFSGFKGVKDSGLSMEVDEKVFPPEERIKGEHIENYAREDSSNFDGDSEASKNITDNFKTVKENIIAELGE